MKYKYLLFDLDGTLMDSSSGITACGSEVLLHYGIKKDPFELKFLIGPSFYDSARERFGLDDKTAWEATEYYRKLTLEKYLYDGELLPYAEESLFRLKSAGYTLYLATNRPQNFADKLAEHFKITQYFEEICGRPSLDGNKTEILQRILLRHPDGAKSEFLMIGDRDQDMQAAKNVGIDALGVNITGFAPEGEIEAFSPVAIVNSLKELCRYLIK